MGTGTEVVWIPSLYVIKTVFITIVAPLMLFKLNFNVLEIKQLRVHGNHFQQLHIAA
jgi:hypothetical protein